MFTIKHSSFITALCVSSLSLISLSGCQLDRSEIKKNIAQDHFNYARAIKEFRDENVHPQPLAQINKQDHPFLAQRGHNSMHADAAMSGTHPESGPTGKGNGFRIGSANMAISLLGGGECGNTTFASNGLLYSFCADFDNFKLYALRPMQDANGNDVFEKLTEYALPERESSKKAKQGRIIPDISLIMSDTSGGAYFRLTKDDHVVLADAKNQLHVLKLVMLDKNGERYVEFQSVRTAYLGNHVENDISYENPEHHDVTDVMPDWHKENIYWFVTRQGKVGIADFTSGTVKVTTIDLAGEEIQNAMAMDENGVYIVSDYAMYQYKLSNNNTPEQQWRNTYDRGNIRKPGQINQGSGTTPTLMGAQNNYVAITDNADPINIVMYDRNSGELMCKEPVFKVALPTGDKSGLSYASATDNSLIGYMNSVIVENNYGYDSPIGNNWTVPGITRVDIVNNPTSGDIENNCYTKWENKTEASQTTVPKLSIGNGLIYIYTREDIPNTLINPDPIIAQAWYFGALDYATGKMVYKTLTGAGRNWNNNYAPITIGPDGTAYVGVFNGIISVKDN